MKLIALSASLVSLLGLHSPTDPGPETQPPAAEPAPLTNAESQPSLNTPNIILIYADDLGLADVGAYGSTEVLTPNIDRLATEGIRFTDFHSNGAICSPSRASLLTGRWAQRTGVQENIKAGTEDTKGLELDETTLPELLSGQLGYRSALVGKWHLGRGINDNFQWMPTNRGFDEAYVQVTGSMDYWSHNNQIPEPTLYRDLTVINDVGYATNLYTQEAVQFMRRNVAQPFFLFLSYNAPHRPPNLPTEPQEADQLWNPPFDTAEKRRRQIINIELMDQGIGTVLQELDSLGLSSNTLVIFTNDNGGVNGVADNGIYRGGKTSFYEGGHRVPFIARMPGLIPANTEYHGLTMGMDLFTTLLSIAGGNLPPGLVVDGHDFSPQLFGISNTNVHDLLYWAVEGRFSKRAVRTSSDFGNLKLVLTKIGAAPAIVELYDLDVDPQELGDISTRRPKVVQKMLNLLGQWEQDVGIGSPR